MGSFLVGLLMILTGSISSQHTGGTFPIPQMQEIWPGAQLNPVQRKLLRNAMAPMLAGQIDSESGSTYSFERVVTADVDLGALGKGVIAMMYMSRQCGTGGCPIYVYVRQKSGDREILDSFGWAFAIVDSHSRVPDLATASNAGGGHITVTLLHYDGHRFTERGCETLSSKQSGGDPEVGGTPKKSTSRSANSLIRKLNSCFPLRALAESRRYSMRRARIGSMDAARPAGRIAAKKEQRASAPIATVNATGSQNLTS